MASRPLLRSVCVFVVLASLAPLVVSSPAAAEACVSHHISNAQDTLAPTAFTEDLRARGAQTWVVGLDDIDVPPPPSAEAPATVLELAELHQAQLARTDARLDAIKRWDEGGASVPWTRVLLEVIKANSTRSDKNPPRISRDIALIETATFDALVVAWEAKACYRRAAPYVVDPALLPVARTHAAPSYPSEHAVVAGVMEVMLPALYGTYVDDLAAQAMQSRIDAGVNYRSDLDAGHTLGRRVAQRVLASRAADGSSATWDGAGRITGTCNWMPTPPAFKPTPLEPVWGKVTPWLMGRGDQLRPAAPPECDSPEYLAAIDDLYRASLHLSDRQKQIALAWAGDPGTETPPGMNLHIALDEVVSHELSTMQAARVLAYEGASLADAAIAAWDAKFTYWWDRPVTAIRRLYDPSWTSFIKTPPFPGYVSGHATFSAASAKTLGYFFPDDAATLRAFASEAAMSRFYAGIHVRYDNEMGLQVGEGIGALAIERAQNDRFAD